jgi:bifunctional non-homologous end joining protein LigD
VPETKRESILEQAPREEMPSRLEPMLAKPGRIPESDSGDWAYEIKWDGIRALGYADHGRWSMLSRRLEDVTARYPELAPLGEALADRAAILDGEVVALDPDGKPRFQLIQSRMGLTSPAAISARAAQTPVDYVIFDLLHLDGHRVRDLTYLQRRELLEELGLEGPRWRTPRHRQGGGAGLLEAARRQGLEGIVAKRSDSPYRPGGAGSGLTEELIGRLTRELRARERPDSPFDIGAPSGPKARHAVWCEPELVCEVSWTEWTDEETLRQPAFKGMVDDKDPREVVREQ